MPRLKKRGLFESQRIIFVPVDDIKPNPMQPRRFFDQDSLKELADSISQYGILQPLNIRKTGKTYELVAGERRLRAAKLAGLTTAPCIVIETDMEEASLIAMVKLQAGLISEEAEGLSTYKNPGISQKKLPGGSENPNRP